MSSLQLPDESRIICLYRNRKFIIPDADFNFKEEDEVVILTHSRNLAYLNKLLLNKPEVNRQLIKTFRMDRNERK